MTRVANLVHHDEFPEVRKDFEATHPPKREQPFRAAYTGVSADVLKWMRAQDAPVPPTAIRDVHDRGTWLPASVGLATVPLTAPRPLPTVDTIAYLAAVSTAMHDDYERHLDTLAVIDAIADLPVHLRAVTMALAPIGAALAEPAPDTSWGTHAEQLAEVAV